MIPVTTQAELLNRVGVVYSGQRVLVFAESAAAVNAVMAELVREGLHDYEDAVQDQALWVASFEAPPLARREALRQMQHE
jgi:hypothetical protein